MKKRYCAACGHSWWPRKEEPPKRCHRCQKPYKETKKKGEGK